MSMSGHVTLYASSRDRAIRLSRKLHKNPRAGAPPLVIIPGIESIDASEMGADFFKHSYFSDSWPLLSDIHELLADDKPAGLRFGLREETDRGRPLLRLPCVNGSSSNLMESGVEFTAIDFPQANRLTVHILAAVAEHEAAMISSRAKAAL
jgi:hypothetical protein